MKDKTHLVPQSVIDCAQNMIETKQEHMKINYVMRLEAIRDYCDGILKMQLNRNVFEQPMRKRK